MGRGVYISRWQKSSTLYREHFVQVDKLLEVPPESQEFAVQTSHEFNDWTNNINSASETSSALQSICLQLAHSAELTDEECIVAHSDADRSSFHVSGVYRQQLYACMLTCMHT